MNNPSKSIKGFMLVGAYPNSVVTFRGDLIRAIQDAGLSACVLTAKADEPTRKEIEETGAEFRSFDIRRNAIDPFGDLRTLNQLRVLFRQLRPTVLLAYTIKPIIWGGIAARAIPESRFYALVTGLGYAFHGGSIKRRLLNALVVRLYRLALRKADGVIFQNADNRDLFVTLGIVPANKCHVVNGSGVNTSLFSAEPMPPGAPRFLLIARLLGEKGIREYAAAARIVKQSCPDASFLLVGPEDPSPDGISLREVGSWQSEGIVNYLGPTDNVRPYLENCHVYVLPSYHEGMPRTVLEAMAVGRPILTTDATGCKETVVPGKNGWLIPCKDSAALADRMVWFIRNRDRWDAMASASRLFAESRFDVNAVNQQMLTIMGIGGGTKP